MDLLITLRVPAEMMFVERLHDRLQIANVEATCDFPAWSTKPDVLMDPATAEFLGLSFMIGPSHSSQVRQMASHLDPRVARYTPQLKGNWKKRYEFLSAHPQIDVLEIVWAESEDMTYLEAMLAGGDFWYFAETQNNHASSPIALGVDNVEVILDQCHLILPNRFSVPVRT